MALRYTVLTGCLIGQFLSPAYNKRDDAYGGSVRNRCRFAIEVAENDTRAGRR